MRPRTVSTAWRRLLLQLITVIYDLSLAYVGAFAMQTLMSEITTAVRFKSPNLEEKSISLLDKIDNTIAFRKKIIG